MNHLSPLAPVLLLVLVGCGGPGSSGTTPHPQQPWPPYVYGGGSSGSGKGSGGAGNNIGDGGSSATDGGSTAPTGDREIDFAARSLLRIQASREVADETGALVIDVARAATGLAGAQTPVFTGTMEQMADGNWQYSPQPSDRLVLRTSTGDEATVQYLSVQGTFDSGEAFMKKDHDLSFRLSSATDELAVRSSATTEKRTQTVAGTRPFDEVICTVDVTLDKDTLTNFDSVGTTSESDETFSGSLNCGAEVLSFTELREYEYLSGSKFNGDPLYYQSLDRMMNHTWTSPRGTYTLKDAKISTFENLERDTFFVTGKVYRNGLEVGRFQEEEEKQDSGSYKKGFLVMPDGRYLMMSGVVK